MVHVPAEANISCHNKVRRNLLYRSDGLLYNAIMRVGFACEQILGFG
jgi:hypothetical protein